MIVLAAMLCANIATAAYTASNLAATRGLFMNIQQMIEFLRDQTQSRVIDPDTQRKIIGLLESVAPQ